MPHPTRKGCAYIQKTARRATVKQPDDPNQRICANCSNQYFVDDSGFPVTENDCFYHWGRLYKFRGMSSKVFLVFVPFRSSRIRSGIYQTSRAIVQ